MPNTLLRISKQAKDALPRMVREMPHVDTAIQEAVEEAYDLGREEGAREEARAYDEGVYNDA